MEEKETAHDWSHRIAAIAVDALLDAGLIQKEQLERAVSIVSEEIYARLCVDDYPPKIGVAK